MFYSSDILDYDEDMKNYWIDDEIQNCSKVLTENNTELKQNVKLIKRNMNIINESNKNKNKEQTFDYKDYNNKTKNFIEIIVKNI